MRVNREKNDSASRSVKVGDVLTVALDSGVRVLRIAASGERRGPAAEARLLYEDLSPPPPAVEAAAKRRTREAARPSAIAGFASPSWARAMAPAMIFPKMMTRREIRPPSVGYLGRQVLAQYRQTG